MREIRLTDEAEEDFKHLDARWKSMIRDAFQEWLVHSARQVSKSRIKRLEDLERPQYRLRVGDMRVFYDVFDDHVLVHGIVPKSKSASWLDENGERNDQSSIEQS